MFSKSTFGGVTLEEFVLQIHGSTKELSTALKWSLLRAVNFHWLPQEDIIEALQPVLLHRRVPGNNAEGAVALSLAFNVYHGES